MSSLQSRKPPRWEVLSLVAHHLDPKTLAVASCVSKSWSIAMSMDHLWQPVCTKDYPSLLTLKFTNPSLPYRRLYALGLTAAKRRCRTPQQPLLSLEDIVFTVCLSTQRRTLVNLAKPCNQLKRDQNGIFRFDVVDVNEVCLSLTDVGLQEMKIKWNVVLEGWGGVFTMMDCVEKLSFAPAAEGWFSEELPSPGCCSGDTGSGVVADLKIGFSGRRGSGEVVVERVSVGILSIVSWRYVSVDDGLRYLQHFLVPSPL